MTGAPRIGLALSGGGARGLALIPVLEALDEMGVRPSVIAGASIGAIMGAGFAAGMRGSDIRHYVVKLFSNRTDVLGRLWQLRPRRREVFSSENGLSLGQFNAERVLENFLPGNLPRTFAELDTPLKVVATDFYGWSEAVIDEGPLFPALAASAAIPLLFRPVRLDGRIMVDGGISNPLPFDLIDDADIVIAVDVVGGPIDRNGRMPGSTEAMFGATQLLMQAITAEKMRRPRPPEIVVRPPVEARVLDFLKAGRIIEKALPVKDELKRLVDQAVKTSELAARG